MRRSLRVCYDSLSQHWNLTLLRFVVRPLKQTIGRQNDKVSYRNYRAAARAIFTLIRAFCPPEGRCKAVVRAYLVKLFQLPTEAVPASDTVCEDITPAHSCCRIVVFH